MSKWRICSHGKHPRLNLEEVRRLAEVVAMNYERRLRGERPEKCTGLTTHCSWRVTTLRRSIKQFMIVFAPGN